MGDKLPFLNWCPQVVEHLVRLDDEGEAVETRYTIRVGDEQATITSAELATGDAWMNRFTNTPGTARRQVKEALSNVVTDQARSLPTTYMSRRDGLHVLPTGTAVWLRACDVEPVTTGADIGPKIRTVAMRSEVVRASKPLPAPASQEDITTALDVMAGHGWGPVLGFSVGIRALAQSVTPVRASLIAVGPPCSGKSLSGRQALTPVMSPGWPPIVDASFSDTLTAIELKVGQAGDRAVLLDDLPLTGVSASGMERDACQKFDAIVRAAANDTPIKERANRDLAMRDGTRVRGIPIITAQRLPAHVQASALRRVVVVEFRGDKDDVPGDNDWRWYAEHGASLDAALRTMGDQVIAVLLDVINGEAGMDGADEWVATCDRIALELLRPQVEARAGGAVPGMDGVVVAAGQMLAGLVMLAGALNVETQPLLDVVVPKLADSLATQAERIGDRHAADTGAGEALGEILRAALFGRRAHIRSQTSDEPDAAVPGQTHQAQGIRDHDMAGPIAEGPALYWLGDQRALGVSSTDLHSIVASSRDTRLGGYTPGSLAKYLLREGVTIPSPQAKTNATHKVNTGRGGDRVGRRLVIIPATLVFGDPDEQEPAPAPPSTTAPGPDEPTPATSTTSGPADEPQGLQDVDEPTPATSTTSGPADEPQGLQDVDEPTPAPATTSGPADEPQGLQDVDEPTPATSTTSRRTASSRSLRAVEPITPSTAAAVGVVVAVERGELVDGQGRRHRLSPDACRDLAALMASVVELVPTGPVTVLVDGGATHRAYGLAKRAPLGAIKPPKAFLSLVAAGWHRPAQPGQTPIVTRSVAMARPERPAPVRLSPVAWLGDGDFPRCVDDDPTSTTVVELADRLRAFRAQVGWDFEGSAGATAVRILRDLVESSAARQPRWQGSAGRWPTPHQVDHWARDLTGDELASSTQVHTWDAIRAYLPAYQQAIVAGDDLQWHNEPQFDERTAGYWRIVVPDMPATPAPVPGPVDLPAGSDVWVTTAVVRLYDELGIMPDILEGWIAPAVQFVGMRRFTELVRDLLANEDTDPAVATVGKQLYQHLHGKLRSPQSAVVRRPDWGHAIRDAAWCNTLRKVWQAAGLMPLPARVAGRERRRTESPAWPVGIRVDEIAYPGGDDARAPLGIEVGEGLGRFRHSGTMTVDQWQAGDRG